MILDDICAHKRLEVEERKSVVSRQELEERVGEVRPPRPFREALRKEGISLIAEIKRASPSKGDLLKGADALNLAALYEQAGARALSVLTDQKYFKGCLQDLTSVRNSVSIPCLRKEFIIDEYQLWESRVAQADAVLLIVRCLSDQQLKDYHEVAEGLGMGVLVESHDAHEIERALASGAHIIGINNRDLATFDVDIHTTLQLKRMVPGGHVLVSESGIHTRSHVRMLEDGGVDAILVGESLVTSNNIAGKVRELLHDDEG